MTNGRLVYVLLLALISYSQVQGKPVKFQIKGSFDVPHVFLTVNAISGVNTTDGSLTSRKLELHWQNIEILPNDWIGIFNYDPNTPTPSQVPLAVESYPVTVGTGEQLTNVRLPEMDLRDFSSQQDNCLGVWVAYFNEGSNVPVQINCFRRSPTWMNDLKDIIGDKPLSSLMIPGTHDTGAWKVYNGTAEDDNIIAKYTFTQEEDIYNQLAYGCRYLDVRVAYYPNSEEKFWVNHGIVRIYPLITLLNDVIEFTKQYNEIVFMDFHRFPVGFDSVEIHRLLYDFLDPLMGDILAPDSFGSQDVTLNTLWNAKKSVILTYGDSFHTEHDVLWPSLYQAWGDVNDPSALETYLQQAVKDNGCRGEFWSAMAEMTPTMGDIIADPAKGLRGFAQDINIPVTYWFQRKEWYSYTGIIATDFFLGNNLIETSITANRDRITCPSTL